MLTRIEIDGFKSFERFELAMPPFAVIVGPNAAGKSNLFDALRLLSQLAVTDVRSAMRELRGEPHELFRSVPGSGPVDRLRIAVETLLPPRVRDAYGQEIPLTQTRLRYELAVERREAEGIERYYVAEERAWPISKGKDVWAPHGATRSKAFEQSFLRYSGRTKVFLDTNTTHPPTFAMHQDGTQGANP